MSVMKAVGFIPGCLGLQALEGIQASLCKPDLILQSCTSDRDVLLLIILHPSLFLLLPQFSTAMTFSFTNA